MATVKCFIVVGQLQCFVCSLLSAVFDEIYESRFEMMFENIASHCVILSPYPLWLTRRHLAQHTFGGSEGS